MQARGAAPGVWKQRSWHRRGGWQACRLSTGIQQRGRMRRFSRNSARKAGRKLEGLHQAACFLWHRCTLVSSPRRGGSCRPGGGGDLVPRLWPCTGPVAPLKMRRRWVARRPGLSPPFFFPQLLRARLRSGEHKFAATRCYAGALRRTRYREGRRSSLCLGQA
jgi:hypothetical protein